MFKKNFRLSLVVFTLLVLFSNVVFAQQEQQSERETKYGIGMQFTYPAIGVSGMVDVAPNISVQGILGPFGGTQSYSVRGIYRFRTEQYWNIYGYGSVGVWGTKYYDLGMESHTEIAPGIGAGAGIEYNWKAIFPNLPPLWTNIEMGFGAALVDFEYGNIPSIWFGCGIHYRF